MSTRGFFLRYASRRALDADHAAYFTHGGMLVAVDRADVPEPNCRVELRIEAPEGPSFRLGGRTGHYVPNRGLMVSFDDDAPGRDALDAFIESAPFREALQREPAAFDPPQVGVYDPAAEQRDAPVAPPIEPSDDPTTDPAFSVPAALFEEATPLDLGAEPRPPGPVDNLPPLAADPGPPAIEDDEGSALHPDVVGLPRARRRPAPSADRPPTVVRAARGGEKFYVAVIKLFQIADYVDGYPRFFTEAELDVEHGDHALVRGQVVLLRLTLPGHNVFEMWSVVESSTAKRFTLRVNDNDEVYRRACLYPDSVAAKARLQRETRGDIESTPTQILLFSEEKAPDTEEKMPIRRRLARMGMDEKINLALSGNREERMALATDSNKAVHHYLLKNAKITLDEIAFMARLPALNPDVLDKIAENPAYTQNPSVTKALVFNPRTPVRTAIRLLDRLPRNELVNLSKRMSMNQRLVMAAKNKLFKVK